MNLMLHIRDFFLETRNFKSADEKVGIKNKPGNERGDERHPHTRLETAATRADDGLRMLRWKEIDRQPIKGNIQQRQQTEHAGERCPFFLVRQISPQHEVRDEGEP